MANPHPVPAKVVLRSQSCNKCTKIYLGNVNSGAVLKSLRQIAELSAAHALTGAAGFDPSILGLVSTIPTVDWKPMTVNEAPVTVPPADDQLGMSLAVFRFDVFDTNSVGSVRHTAEMSYTGADPQSSEIRFEVPIVIVTPAQLAPNNMELADIKAGDVRTVNYIIWSATRDAFPVDVPQLPNDPCFVFGQPKALTPQDCEYASYKIPVDYPTQPPTRIRAGYIVPLTIHENLNGNLLDLGPFRKHLTFNQGTPFETVAVVSGSVRGDIRIEGKDDEQISLGNFRGDRPMSKTVIITAMRPDLDLRFISCSPDFVKANMKQRPGVASGWELKLEIAPNTHSGPLPAGSAVILELGGAKPRRIRIPVVGSAYQ
jgi:hypothetical protein